MALPLKPHTLDGGEHAFWYAEVASVLDGPGASPPLWCLIDPGDATSFPVGSAFTYEGQSYEVLECIPFLHGLPLDHVALRLQRSISLS